MAARLNAANGHAGKLPFLVLMTDDERLADPLGAARVLPRGSMVVVRSREASRRAELANALMRLARDLVVLIADDPQLARTIHADGLHLPEARAHEFLHWRALQPSWLITTSVHSFTSLLAARHADAVFVSPVFATKSHPGRGGLGAVRLMRMASQVSVPVYALGGVEGGNAGRLACAAGLAGIAAIDGLSLG